MNPQASFFGGTIAAGGGTAVGRGPLYDFLPSRRRTRTNSQSATWREATGVVSLSLAMMAFLFIRTPQRVDGDSLPAASSASVGSVAAVRESTPIQGTDGLEPLPKAEPVLNAEANLSNERLSGEKALSECATLLKSGISEFEKHPAYTAKFFKQERIGDTLHEGEEIDLKLAHKPMQVYMKWRSGLKGQQAIYSEEQFDGKLLVQPGGVAGRLCGVLKFDVDGDEALAQSRYQITSVGLTALARKIVDQQTNDLQNKTAMTCSFEPNVTFEGKLCHRFTGEYASPEAHPVYRTFDVMIDPELKLPIWVRNTGWIGDKDASEEDSLVELYSYTDIETADEVTASDFDPGNRRYAMRIKQDLASNDKHGDKEDTAE